MEKKIVKVLNKLGVPVHLKGYKYIVEAIALCYENTEIRMSKELYIEIASRHNDKPSRVERAIRHAIEVTWSKIDEDVSQEIFGNSIDARKGKPVNTQFLKTVASYLKYNEVENYED